MVAVACGGMLIGGLPLNAAPPVAVRSPAPTPVLDVALSAGGTLIGHVLDAQGRPQAGVQVAIEQGRWVVASPITDRDGRFIARNLTGGMYLISAGQARGLFRLWAANSAPPQARPAAVLVSVERAVVRGHHVETVVDELDLITLTMTGTAIASLALVAIMYGRLDDVEDRLVQHDLSGPGPPASP